MWVFTYKLCKIYSHSVEYPVYNAEHSFHFFKANEEKREMDALQHSNKRILFNLLPAHVATHFLDNQFRSNMVTLEHMQQFLHTYTVTCVYLIFLSKLRYINNKYIKF